MSAEEAELRRAWARCAGDQQLFEALLARHREPHRSYHGIRHVAWVVRHVDDLANSEPTDDLPAVIVAAFFHDAVYDPTATDNEAASARLATVRLRDLGWAEDRIEHVAAMILATGHHVSDPVAAVRDATSDADAAVLLDADLAVLGAEPGAYQSYVNGVRAEFSHVDDDGWRSGRRAVVERLLDRPVLYHTPTGAQRWGARARANLSAELATLG